MDKAHAKFIEKLQLTEYETEPGNPQSNTLENPLKGDIVGIPYMIEYSGGFGGFDAALIDEIEAGFTTKKELASFCVTFSTDDERPRSKTYEEVIERVADAYGPADMANEPKDTATRLAKVA
jgi:hypothetical protein